ncbi:cytochrome C biogenesis protein [Plantibacter sp. H53]|uniref:cytochrome c biogenesis protein ResB n=1 Tax=unclassified Plantibacter TaxID=2624265 RepID=UPI0007D9742F|nr:MULTISPECIES: cytochrome c biogenesis protein ResB [unclassified Plantibacter]OAN34732.1 cytochrome C biogenesis protein [Plantibacter sp. H53]OII43349.1 cytochrome C biogenesis protein [Plantibacter sp. MMLR14_011]
MSRPSDHIDSAAPAPADGINQPKLGFVGWLRFFWRQLTSMRTALFLLLLLAIAAVPGSLVPQRSSDPNGVTQYFTDNPDLAPILDKVQAFDVYSSAWFSAIYLLLFISLIGCVIPRTKHHWLALRSRPPRTPARLSRLSAFERRSDDSGATAAELIDDATKQLKRQGYRVERYDAEGSASVSAERGFLRETGNLVFHSALVGILVTVGFGGGFGFSGQRVLVEGQTFVNTLLDYDSFNPGRFFNESELAPYKLTLDEFGVTYETENLDAYGQAIDYRAKVTTTSPGGKPQDATIKVNDPLRFEGTDVYLLGNGYAPTITVRDPEGKVVFSDSIPFLPQDAQLTSLGIVKVPDGLAEQLGMIGFFYPTQAASKPPFFSSYPDLAYPVLTLNVYSGDLGINAGAPKSVYALDVDDMKQLTGGDTGVESIELTPGQITDLPNGLGTVSFDNVAANPSTENYAGSVKRFASFDVHHDPTQLWVLAFAILALSGLITSLFVARRRVWVKAVTGSDGTVSLEYAGLARGEDPGLEAAVAAIAEAHSPTPVPSEPEGRITP